MKCIIKKLSNFIRVKDTKYSSNLKTECIDCDILVGSCPNIHPTISSAKDAMSHIIFRYIYNRDRYRDQESLFIKICHNKGIKVFIHNDDSNNTHLFIAGNIYSFNRVLFAARQIDDNNFVKLLIINMMNYTDNLINYNNDEISFEFTETKHRNIRHAPSKSTLDILGYSYVPNLPNSLGCIWISGSPDIIKSFKVIDSIHYYESPNIIVVKMNLEYFIDYFNYNILEHDYNIPKYRDIERIPSPTDDMFSIRYPLLMDKDIFYQMQNIIDNDQEYFKTLKMNLDGYTNTDNEEDAYIYDQDIDTEEREISMEEFFNSAVDEILRK